MTVDCEKYLLISLVLLFGLTDVTFGQSKWEKFLKKVEKASQEAQKIDKQVQQLKKQAEKSGRKQSTSVPHFKDISKTDFINGKHKTPTFFLYCPHYTVHTYTGMLRAPLSTSTSNTTSTS